MVKVFFLCLMVFSCSGQDNQNSFQYKESNFHRSFVDMEGVTYIPVDSFSSNPNKNLKVINEFLRKNVRVGLPDLDIIIAKQGIELNDFNVLFFSKNTNVIMEPNDLIKYQVIKAHGVKNVKIVNPTITGDREKHIGSDGEWGHGISIIGSQNVEVLNYNIKKCWGDGIYIGILGKQPSKNIILNSGFVDYNRRNGISVVSGESIFINDVLISNTYGTLPMFGLDIEPNDQFDQIDNVKIQNIRTVNNYEGGIQITLHKMKKAKNKNVKISIDNHQDYGSKIGLYLNRNLNDFLGLKGEINVKNLKFYNTKEPIVIKKQENSAFLIKIDSIIIEDNKKKKINFLKRSKKYNEFKNVNISYNEN